jgi:hypothetical protein
MGSPFPGLNKVFLASFYYLPARPPEARAVPDSGADRRADAQEVDRGAPHDRPAVLNTERVTRSHRIGAADFVRAASAETRLRREEVVDEQPHGQGGGVPAAGDQPAEGTVGRGHRIDAEVLRIEPFSKRYDASCVDADAAALAGGAEGIVLKVAQIVIIHLPSITEWDP